MFGTKISGILAGVFVATVFAPLVTLAIHSWVVLRPLVTAVVLLVLWVGFYMAISWAVGERRSELDRKFPITSSEHRRRRKQLYDWLSSQGRR